LTFSRTAGAVTNYQVKLLIAESLGNRVQVTGCENTTGWGSSGATVSAVAGIEGTNCIKIAGSVDDAYASFTFSAQNWSATRSLIFKQRRDGSTQTGGQCFIFDSSDNWVSLNFVMTNGWTEISFDTSRPDASSGVMNWASIVKVRFDANYSGTNLYVDDIRRDSAQIDCGGLCLSSFNDLRFTASACVSN
jgi:hypothetical protein